MLPSRVCKSAVTVSSAQRSKDAILPPQVARWLQAALHTAPWSLRLRAAAARALADAGPEIAAAAARLWPLHPPLRAAVGDRLSAAVRNGRAARVGGGLVAGDGGAALAADLQACALINATFEEAHQCPRVLCQGVALCKGQAVRVECSWLKHVMLDCKVRSLRNLETWHVSAPFQGVSWRRRR